MNTYIVKMPYVKEVNSLELPVTGRGRALYTIDWFLNGIPVSNSHDNMLFTIDDCNNN